MNWEKKPKVLLVGDSSAIHTGFAKVIKNIATHLYDSGNYEIETIGWFHNPTEEIVPYKIHSTDRSSPQAGEVDKYGQNTFPRVVKKFKPDLVLAVGDSWMIDHIALSPERGTYKLLLYVPIDGMPIPKEWIPAMEKADTTVLYGDFGKRVVSARAPHLSNIHTINHGVDTDVFKPIDEDVIKEIKRQMGGEDTFLIGCVARNQPRKNLPRLFKAFNMFLKEWTSCDKCAHMVFEKVRKCEACGSKEVYHGKEKKDTKLYLHMALRDCGWNIYEMIERFELKGKVAYPAGLQVARGIPREKLAEIMGAFDVFTLPTSGEGWGLPILEAMSCGLPTVVTDYSAHTEFCHGAADLIAVSEYVSEPMTNIERALVDITDYCMRLDKLYYEDVQTFFRKWGRYFAENFGEVDMDTFTVGKAWREKLGKEARLRALNYTWDRVNNEWETLVNKTLEYVPSECEVKEVKVDYLMEEL